MSPEKFACLSLFPDSPKKLGESLPSNTHEIRREAELHSDVTTHQLQDHMCYSQPFIGYHTKIWIGFQSIFRDSRYLMTKMAYEIARKSIQFFPSSLCGTIPNLRLLNFPSWVGQSTFPLLPVPLRQNG